ncbi:OX-2 membrane glycoprotein isoform X1 [Varanus komodoensis]|uniref:CD200 molecule n=3 Tax=Varanus komodoensis TaxID=61221 RepID=A0A8D2L8F5_VARKO|nr:OX-2 membrane glycoprotein isoform X1 [Varanus komodoensis]
MLLNELSQQLNADMFCFLPHSSMHRKANGGICSLWTSHSLTLCIISIMLCRIQGSVRTQNDEVELGGTGTLRCNRTEYAKSTFQVTWRKEINGNAENMATFREDAGPNILPTYKDKIKFTTLGNKENAITFLNVSINDNGCYQCIFATMTGEVRGRPCLLVYDHLHAFLYHNIYDGHLNATCLATGFPRPNISWVAPESKMNEYESLNPNGTISVISNIIISTSIQNVKQKVICKVSHRGEEKEIKLQGKKGLSRPYAILIGVLALILVILVIVAAYCWSRHRKTHSG